jgi:hypothetical protein
LGNALNAGSINKWLSLGANVGVLIGLILLLVEIDQNNDLVRAQIHQARSDTHVSNRLQIADSEFLILAVEKFYAAGGFNNLSALDQLTAVEVARIREWMIAFHQDYDNLFYQYQQGYLDNEFYRYRVEVPISIFAPWWEKLDIFESAGRRPSFDAEVKRIKNNSQ